MAHDFIPIAKSSLGAMICINAALDTASKTAVPDVIDGDNCALSVMMRSLVSDELVAYAQAGATVYYRIPSRFWRDTWSDTCLSGMMCANPTRETFPPFLTGKPVEIEEGSFRLWLAPPATLSAATSSPEPAWTEETMKAAIADCGISNRDRAWSEKFKALRDQHGWGVEAFRSLWSDARGTKGATGRPPKRA